MGLFATAQTTFSVSILQWIRALETRKTLIYWQMVLLVIQLSQLLSREELLSTPIMMVLQMGQLCSGHNFTKVMLMRLIYLRPGNIGETSTSLFLEASNGVNWNPSTNYTIVGGYVSYDVNASSEQTTSALYTRNLEVVLVRYIKNGILFREVHLE